MLKDFLIGTLGKFLQAIFAIAGFLFIIGGLFGGSGIAVFIGILFICMAAGIRYALGYICKIR